MIPRSDKFYVYLTIVMGAIVIVISIIAAVAAFSGSGKPNPAYESAAPPAVMQAPDRDGIANPSIASRPPISDHDYITLHRTTRRLAVKLIPDGISAALSAGLPAKRANALRRGIKDVQDLTSGLQQVGRPDVAVNRPVNGETTTSAAVTYAGELKNGTQVEPVVIDVTVFWKTDPVDGRLKINDVTSRFTGGEAVDSSADDGSGA